MIKRIGVIGAGQMGSGIAHVCALKGYDIRLVDIDQSRLVADNYGTYAARPNPRIWVVLFGNEPPAPAIADALSGLTVSQSVDVLRGHGLLYERPE